MCFGRRGGWSTGGSVELLRQRELMPIVENEMLPMVVALSLHCPLLEGRPASEMEGRMP